MYLNALVEKCLRRDFCKSIRLLSYLKVSDYRSTGWFSANSMLLFACFNDLAISSTVRAHGHLSQTTLAFFYPVLSTRFIVNTEEEAFRIQSLSKEKLNVDYLLANFFSTEDSLSSRLASFPKVILALSTPDCLKDAVVFSKYKFLVSKLLRHGFTVAYKAHHHATLSDKILLSSNNSIPLLDIDIASFYSANNNSIMLGSSSTVLIDAKFVGMPAYEILDFHTNISQLIKSVPCTSINNLICSLPV